MEIVFTLKLEDADRLTALKSKIQLFVVCRKYNSLAKTHTD
jgi:hypothetical protein